MSGAPLGPSQAGLPAPGSGEQPGGTGTTTMPDAAAPGSLRHKLRAWRLWIILGLVLAAGVALGLLTGSDGDRAALSAENPAPAGAQALARVLRDQGVDVVVAKDHAAAMDGLRAGEATLLLFDPNEFLGHGQLEDLADAAAKTVLVEPTFTQLGQLAPGITHAGLVPQDVLDSGMGISASCPDPAAQAAGSVTAGGLAYRGPVTCFPVTGGESPAGLFAASEDGTEAVFGYTGLLANESITGSGNAALAL
ncbi:DUF4350 domain-containing protein, partial [Arthrobacter sp.]|uniref:DUF4350 domain-containing protein n=1 Tax=Arthrobacter sp. TaxID=1667 RepID=UPI002899CD2B